MQVVSRLRSADPAVDVGAPAARESFPVAAGRGAFGRQRFECRSDLLEGDPRGAAGLDERDLAQSCSTVAALVSTSPVGADQGLRLVEAEGRGGDAAAGGELSDCQLLGHLT